MRFGGGSDPLLVADNQCIDPKEMENRYSVFVKNIESRDDLNHLIDDMLGELCVGHEFRRRRHAHGSR